MAVAMDFEVRAGLVSDLLPKAREMAESLKGSYVLHKVELVGIARPETEYETFHGVVLSTVSATYRAIYEEISD